MIMYWTIARSGTHDVVGLSHGVWNSISDLGPPPTLDGLELDQFAGTVTQTRDYRHGRSDPAYPRKESLHELAATLEARDVV